MSSATQVTDQFNHTTRVHSAWPALTAMLLRVLPGILAIHICWGYGFYYGPSLSAPQRHPELGLYPQYQALVYNYINGMAGPHQPPKVHVFPTRIEDFGINEEPVLIDNGSKEPVTERPGVSALRPSSLLPSDFILLAAAPQSQFFGSFDVVKTKKMKLGVDEGALPPIGGVVSNYILQRGADEKSPLVKRQTYYDSDEDEGVVVNASSEPRAETTSNSTSDSNQKEEPTPSVAQSKPSAIALAGVGGVAQAAPVGTAVVGEGGLAIAAPSATAVAGQGTGGAIQIAGDEKMKKRSDAEKNDR